MSARPKTNLRLATEPDFSGVFDRAIEIGRRRADTLRQLRSALESGDDALALSIAREVCGLNVKAVSPIAAGQHGRASRSR
jgi:hypothetical protein